VQFKGNFIERFQIVHGEIQQRLAGMEASGGEKPKVGGKVRE
jgi:hypothetical protein